MKFHRDPSDRQFRRFCKTGDPDALGCVFDLTAGRLLRVAVWLAGNRTDAEDLLQRTFLKVIETREQFRIGEPVLPWLMGLLGNEARRQRRERGRSVPVTTDKVVDPEAVVVARELEETVRSVGERLGAPYREVLQLHLEGGLNCKEIAARLERPAGTVRTQMMRALDLLRRRLPIGFAAGMTAVAVPGASSLVVTRDAVVAAASDALASMSVGAVVVAAPLEGVLMTKGKLLAVALLTLLGGAVVIGALWSNGSPLPPAKLAAVATSKSLPGTELARQREVASVREPLQDPVPLDLPTLSLLGARPGADPAVVVDAFGRRLGKVVLRDGATQVVLRIDRRAPWSEVAKLLDELRAKGIVEVRFASQLPDGVAGYFTIALPANGKATAEMNLRLHRDRDGVSPFSVVPVLRRIVRGRSDYLACLEDWRREDLKKRFPVPYLIGIAAPGDASFEQVLHVMAAVSSAGGESLLLTSGEVRGGGDTNATLKDRGSLAIDLGPYPRVAVRARQLAVQPAKLMDAVVGCPKAAVAPVVDNLGYGAGGRYGARGRKRDSAAEIEKMGWSPALSIRAGIKWLKREQQPDGSFLGSDGRPDLEATALVMLALLGEDSLYRGTGSEALSKGLGWILDQQNETGCFCSRGREDLRSHATATYALAEAYGLSFCVAMRGGLCDATAWLGRQWLKDCDPENDVDANVTDAAAAAMTVMAFTTAEFFQVEGSVTSKQVVAWFDTGARRNDPTVTATELFARVMAGLKRKDKKLLQAVDWLAAAADPGDPWCQYWTSYCLYQLNGKLWRPWYARLAGTAEQQVADGEHAGSWSPAHGQSRVTTTALRMLSMQSSQRYSRLLR